MKLTEIITFTLTCVYGPGDNYNPCNRGKPIHLTVEEYMNQIKEIDEGWRSDFFCPRCKNSAFDPEDYWYSKL